MYQQSTVCVSKEAWDVGFSWTRIFMPGGAKGVALKLKFPYIAAYSDKLGLVWGGLSILRVIVDCSMSLSHSFIGKLGSHYVIPGKRWFLKVWMALYVELRKFV